MSEEIFDPYYTWLGIPVEERPINFYRLLGIAHFEPNPEVISNAADQRMGHVRTFQNGRRAKYSQQLLNELSSASICLLDPDKKAVYDQKLRDFGVASSRPNGSRGSYIEPRKQLKVTPRDYSKDEELTLQPEERVSEPKRELAKSPDASRREKQKETHGPASRKPTASSRQITPSSKNTASTRTDPEDAPAWNRPFFWLYAGVACVLVIGSVFVALVLAWKSSDSVSNAPPPNIKTYKVTTIVEEKPYEPRHKKKKRERDDKKPVVGVNPRRRDESPETTSSPTSVQDPKRNDVPPETDDDAGTSGAAERSTTTEDEPKPTATTDPDNDQPDTGTDPEDDPSLDLLPLETPTRPAPPAAELAEAKKSIQDLYRKALSDAKTTEQLARMSDLLYQESLETVAAPAEHFALLDISANLAIRSGRYRKAWTVLDEMQRHFSIVVVSRKADALKRASRRFEAPREMKMASKDWIQLVEDAVREDQYELARQYAIDANRMALKTFDKDFSNYVNKGLDAVQQLLAAYKERKEDHEAVLDGNGRADAKQTARWGRFLCEYKNDWKQGLPLWRVGSDRLAAVAALDLAAPQNADDQLRIGDQWWSAAEAAGDKLPKRFLKTRAIHWYRLAHTRSAGLDRRRIEGRLKDVELDEFAFERGKAIDLIELFDMSSSGRGGWSRRGGQIGVANARSRSGADAYVTVDGDYEIQSLLTRSDGADSFGLRIPVGLENHVHVVIGNQIKGYSGLEHIEGRRADENPTTRQDEIVNKQQHCLRIRVNKRDNQARIKVWLDGRNYIDWRGLLEDLPRNQAQRTGIELLTEPGNALIFDRLQLSLLSGEALPTLDRP